MADTKITDLPELTTPAADDELVIVDGSDTSSAASGTTKKVSVSDLLSFTADAASPGYDLIVAAGQSNMSGRGTSFSTTFTDPGDPRIFQYGNTGTYADQVSMAAEPLEMHDTPSGIGPSFQFARWYAQSVPIPRRVLLVPVAHGGTGFTGATNWDVDTSGSLYDNMVSQSLAALEAAGDNSQIVAVLWAQGENDALASMSQATYEGHLDALIDGFRSDVADVPFIISQMLPAFIAEDTDTVADINTAHIETPYRKVRTAFTYGPSGYVESDGLTIHYSAPGQRILARSMLSAVDRANANVLSTAPDIPTGLALEQSGTSVIATWDQPVGRVTDFTVEYQLDGAGSWTTLARSRSIDVTATITGLTKGDTYHVRVSTVNEEGTSSPTSATIDMVDDPAQVTGLAAGTTTLTSVPLTWDTQADATSFLIEYKAHADSTWLESGTVTTNSGTVTGLAIDTSYDFRVSAVNAAGTGTASSTVTASTQPVGYLMADVSATPWRAYSLRQLDSSYAGSAIRVRRSSDSTEQDIGFSSGELDTASLLTFAGSGSAFIKTWYDQSGNGHDLTQTTTANQPRIVNSGTVDTKNSKPAAVFNGTSQYFTDSTPGLYSAGACSILGVAEASASAANDLVVESNATGTPTPNRYQVVTVQTAGRMSFGIVDSAGTTVVSETTAGYGDVIFDGSTLHQFSVTDDSSTWTTRADGGTPGTKTYSRSGHTLTLTAFDLGALVRSSTALFFNGSLSEIVLWTSVLSDADRTAGETNQQSYYATP